MFRFQHDGKIYSVSFKHVRNDPSSKPQIAGQTTCYLRVCQPEGGWTETAKGMAHCSVHDQWNRYTGRKIALSRALAKFFFDRAFRRLVWNCYHLISNQWGHIAPGWHQPASQALNGAGTALPERPKDQELVLPPLV